MPLTEKGREIKNAMIHEYGSKEGEQVFYASKNAGKISGVDAAQSDTPVRDECSIHPAFQGDRSLYAGPGRGIDAVPEYKPSYQPK